MTGALRYHPRDDVSFFRDRKHLKAMFGGLPIVGSRADTALSPYTAISGRADQFYKNASSAFTTSSGLSSAR